MAIAVRREAPSLFWSIVVLVVMLPLPLGAVYQWSWGLMALVVGLVLAIWCGRVTLGIQEPAYGLRSIWPIIALFFLVIFWISLQAQTFTPRSWHHPLWTTASEALGGRTASAISLNPYDTVSGLVRLLAYAGIFWISFQYSRRAARARQVMLAVVYGGLAYALYGLVIYISGSQTILIFQKVAYLDDLTSTFVNRNSYATYAGLGLICSSGLVFALVTQTIDSAGSSREQLGRALENTLGRGWPLLLSWIVLLVALVLSHSRAGFFSALLGLLALVGVAGMTRAVDRRLAIAFGGLCAAGLIWGISVGGEHLIDRLLNTSLAVEERPLVYDRTIAAIEDTGSLGTGFGTFEDAFRFYRTIDIRGNFNMAHNTYLENVLELGLPAALALFGVLAGFLVLCGIGVHQRRRDAVYPCIGFAVTVQVSAHSTIDFSLQIPAVVATYMLIMGAACAQCWSSRRPPDPW